MQLSGPLPTEIGLHTTLLSIDVSACGLDGTLPTGV